MAVGTALAIVGIIIGVIVSATTTTISVRRANKAARNQYQAIRDQQQLKNAEILRRLQQEQDAGEERAADVAIRGAQAAGAVKALAGVGVSARSITALRHATALQTKQELATVQKQDAQALGDAFAGIDVSQANANALAANVDRPSYAAAGLQILGSAIEGGTAIAAINAKKDKL